MIVIFFIVFLMLLDLVNFRNPFANRVGRISFAKQKLNATQKKYILCTKYAQNRDDFFSKVHLSFRQKKKSFISIVLKLHHNHIEFNLLRNIKFPIIKFNLNLFGIIDFIFKLGK
jgi:hypothetical protein